MAEVTQLIARDCDDVFQAGYLSTLVRPDHQSFGERSADIANRRHLRSSEESICWQPTTAQHNYARILTLLLVREHPPDSLDTLVFPFGPRSGRVTRLPLASVPSLLDPKS